MAEEITEVNETLLPMRQDTTATPAAGRADTVTATPLLLLRGFFAGRRFVSFPLLIVRYIAMELLDDWREDFGYLLPVVVFEAIWNLAFVAASVVMLILSVSEKPNEPVRVWICVYSLQCVVHVVLVCSEYVRRNRLDSSGSSDSTTEISTQISPYRRWERINTVISHMWALFGIIWMANGNKILLHDAPRLFWLTLAFLASDTFFVVVSILISCSFAIACLFCCPCIIYQMFINTHQEPASENEISTLPKYKYEMSNDEEQNDDRAGRMIPMDTNDPNWSVERLTHDPDCRICLSSYENGSELLLLPCNHNFHAACLGKWLRQNGFCPLCKYKIAGYLQEGASEDEINVLPKYKFEMSNDEKLDDGRAGRMVPMETNDPELCEELLTLYVDCCICLGSYVNGSELQLLPCNHNFHVACLGKWLRQNADVQVQDPKISTVFKSTNLYWTIGKVYG